MKSIKDPTIPNGLYERCYWQGTEGCASNLALCNAAANADAPILLICENNEVVEQSIRELKYFCLAHKELTVFSLPDWETLPYDNFSPHQDIISERLSALFNLPQLERGILVLSITSLMHQLPPHKYIAANSFDLKVGQQLSIDKTREQLTLAGYQSVNSVFEHGEFAVRGSIIDIFPMGSLVPFRIDLFDDEIETLRTFDPESQRSEEQVQEIKLLPGREFPLDDDGIALFRARFHELFNIDVRQCPLYQDVSDGINSPGLEYYLALFFDELNTLFNFMPNNTIIVKQGDLKAAGEQFWRDIKNRYEDRLIDRYRPVLHPKEVFVCVEEIFSQARNYRQIEFKTHDNALDLRAVSLPELGSDAHLTKPFSNVERFLTSQKNRTLFCAESAGRRETLIELLKHIDVNPSPVEHWSDFVIGDCEVGITVAPLDHGMWLKSENLVLITESQLFGNRIAQRRRRSKTQNNTDFIVKSLTELRIDDSVVHLSLIHI